MEEGEKLNLSGALALFVDNLDDIKEAVADNILYALAQLPTPLSTGDANRDWVRREVHALQVKDATETRTRILKRIVAYQQNSIRPRVGITDADIERAKEYPIADLCDGRVFKSSGKWIAHFHCPLPDHGGEKTPSFFVDKKNRFKCFGCASFGSVVDVYMKINNASFVEAVKALSSL